MRAENLVKQRTYTTTRSYHLMRTLTNLITVGKTWVLRAFPFFFHTTKQCSEADSSDQNLWPVKPCYHALAVITHCSSTSIHSQFLLLKMIGIIGIFYFKRLLCVMICTLHLHLCKCLFKNRKKRYEEPKYHTGVNNWATKKWSSF